MRPVGLHYLVEKERIYHLRCGRYLEMKHDYDLKGLKE